MTNQKELIWGGRLSEISAEVYTDVPTVAQQTLLTWRLLQEETVLHFIDLAALHLKGPFIYYL